MLNLICKHTATPMLLAKIKQIQKQFNQFCSEISENNKFSNNIEREETVSVFFLNNVYYILTKLTDFDAIMTSDDSDSFYRIYDNKFESYINLLFRKHFEDLNKVLQNCFVRNEGLESIRDTNRDMNRSILDPNDVSMVIDKKEIDKVNKTELKSIAVNFNSKYREKLEKIKKEISEAIKDKDNSKSIIKKFLHELVNK